MGAERKFCGVFKAFCWFCFLLTIVTSNHSTFFYLPYFLCEEASLNFYIGALCEMEATPPYGNLCMLVLKRFAACIKTSKGIYNGESSCCCFVLACVRFNVTVATNPREFIPLQF